MKLADLISDVMLYTKTNKEALNKEIVVIEGKKKKKILGTMMTSNKIMIRIGDCK